MAKLAADNSAHQIVRVYLNPGGTVRGIEVWRGGQWEEAGFHIIPGGIEVDESDLDATELLNNAGGIG